MAHTGILKRVSNREDEDGKTVLEAVVHFYNGDAPDLPIRTIWHREPVQIVRAALTTGKNDD